MPGRLPPPAQDGAPVVLVCFAVKQEAKFLLDQSGHCKILITGIGRQNAEAKLRAALGAFRPALILCCGFAGGLNPQLPFGQIVFAADDDAPLAARLLKLGAVPGRFHCATRVAATASEKQNLRQTTQADAVDMESEAHRQVCRQRHISSAIIRVISDTAQEDLPLDFNAFLGPDLRMNYARLACSLLLAPGRIRTLIAFQRRIDAAAQKLAEVLRRVLAVPGQG